MVALTPPPSHTRIEEVPGKLQLNMNNLYSRSGKFPPTTTDRTMNVLPVNLLHKRKTKPRVYEYEPGSASKYIESIKDDEKRQAAMKAFIRATYPPRGDFVPPKDNNSYDETLGANQLTGLRQPVIGDVGIPDTKTLLLVLAFRAAFNDHDVNTAVKPTPAKQSILTKERAYDEYASDDDADPSINDSSDDSGDDDDSTPDESSPSPSPLPQTTVKRIRLVKKTQPVAPSSATSVDSNNSAVSAASTIMIEKSPVTSRKRDHDEYASDDDANEGAAAHDDHATGASNDENKENTSIRSALQEATVKRIRLSKKTAAAPVDIEAPVQAAGSSVTTTTATATISNNADAPTADSIDDTATTAAAPSASGSQENTAIDHAPAPAPVPAPKRKYTRKAVPEKSGTAKVTGASKQRRGRKPAASTAKASATKATSRKTGGAGRKKAAKKDHLDYASDGESVEGGYGPMGIVTRSMKSRRG